MLHCQSASSSVFQKVLVNEPHPGSPVWAPMERVAHFQSLLLHVSRIPHKSYPDKKKFQPSLEGPRKKCPPCSPKWGPYGNRRLFPEPHLTYPSGSPVKEPSLQVPLIELPQRERERYSVSEPPIHLSKSLVYEPPSRVPSGAPMERDACFQSLLLHNLQVPQ